MSNILSAFDITNVKIATNLNQVLIDSRWEGFENNRIVNVDIANNGILRRLIKHLETDTGQTFMLNGSSALKFLSWVGSVVNYPEINDVTLAHMQALYNVLLNTGQVDYETISFIKPYLSELSFPSLADLSRPNLPLNISLGPSQTQQQETQGTTY